MIVVQRVVPAFMLFLLVLTVACGGGNKAGTFTNDGTAESSAITPILISSDLSVGTERVSVGVLKGDVPLTDAKVRFKLYRLVGDQGTLVSEADARDIKIQVAASERHSDGSVETHQPGSIGVYVANLEFDQPGDWGLELTGKAGGKDLGSVKVRLPVRAQEIGIAAGSPAPKSVQTTLRDVARLDEIDTSSIPDPVMHGQTVAEALASKYPTVIVFATPGFCRSRICGPVKAIVDDLDKTFGRSVNFVHIEPYDLAKARNGQLSPIPLLEQEWHLSTEPWIFVVGRDGLVKAKFEAAVDKEEVEAVLRSLLAP